MSYPSAPPPSGGVNPYGSQPEQPGPAPQPDPPAWQTPSGTAPAYGTPPSGYEAQQPSSYDAPQPPPQHGSPTGYGAPTASYSPYVSTPGAPGYAGWYASSRDNGKGTGALVMGILSIVLCFGSLLGLGLGIGAIVMGSQGRRAADAGTADNRGVAMTGFVLGIVGVVLSAFASLGYLVNLTQT